MPVKVERKGGRRSDDLGATVECRGCGVCATGCGDEAVAMAARS